MVEFTATGDFDLTTEAGLISFGNDLVDKLRECFADQGQLPPGAALVATLGPDGTPLPHPSLVYVMQEGEFDRVPLSLALHRIAEQYQANGVFFFAESWTVDFESEQERALWRGRDWGEHPRAKERVYCSFEHLEFQGRSWQAFITRDARGKGLLEPFECLKVARSRGLFTGFLRYAHAD